MHTASRNRDTAGSEESWLTGMAMTVVDLRVGVGSAWPPDRGTMVTSAAREKHKENLLTFPRMPPPGQPQSSLRRPVIGQAACRRWFAVLGSGQHPAALVLFEYLAPRRGIAVR